MLLTWFSPLMETGCCVLSQLELKPHPRAASQQEQPAPSHNNGVHPGEASTVPWKSSTARAILQRWDSNTETETSAHRFPLCALHRSAPSSPLTITLPLELCRLPHQHQRRWEISEADDLHREQFHRQVHKKLSFKQMIVLHNQQIKWTEESVWTALLYPEIWIQPQPALAHQSRNIRKLHSRCCFPRLFLFLF